MTDSSESPAPPLSFWLQLMLAEIAAKREAQQRASAEEALRAAERAAAPRAAAPRAAHGADPR